MALFFLKITLVISAFTVMFTIYYKINKYEGQLLFSLIRIRINNLADSNEAQDRQGIIY